MLVGVLLTLEYDLLAFWDDYSSRERRVRLEEVLALTAVLGLGISVFVVRRMYEERRDLRDRLQAETEMGEYRALALQDPLTALPNRRAIRAALETAIASAEAKTLAFYLLDLNGFKRVNDEHGHAIGDEVLRAVAQRFRGVARKGDVVAPLGGDEFAALAVDGKRPEGGLEIGQRFVTALGSGIGERARTFAAASCGRGGSRSYGAGRHDGRGDHAPRRPCHVRSPRPATARALHLLPAGRCATHVA